MTLYQFISKFTDERIKVINCCPNKPSVLAFEGSSYSFLATIQPESRLGRTRYYQAHISDDKRIIIIFQYNREVKE